MSYISVNDLQQGMILGEDVRDINTRLLLSKGQKISAKHLRIFNIWGITEVKIAGTPIEKASEEAERDPEKFVKIEKATKKVFQFLDTQNIVIDGIYQAALAYRYKNNLFPDPASHRSPSPDPEALNKLNNIKSQIQKIDIKLPEAPSIILELNEVIEDPFASANDIAQVVNKSPSLAALLLKIVNSAFYGFPSKIDRISRAVTIIGTKEISGLAMGISVMRVFSDIPASIVNMPAFLKHCLACGIISRILAAHKNIEQTEQLFISGLLHDIGKLIVFKYFPDHARVLFELAEASGNSFYSIEKNYLGQRHPRIGQYLLRKWKLPLELEDTIVFHHTPSLARDTAKACIVQMADLLSNGLGFGSSGELSIPVFDGQAWEKMGISAGTIKMVIRQAEHQLRSMEAVFQQLK